MPDNDTEPTIRDFFAANSMAAAYERAQKASGTDIERLFYGNRANITIYEITAKLAYLFADAMLKERR